MRDLGTSVRDLGYGKCLVLYRREEKKRWIERDGEIEIDLRLQCLLACCLDLDIEVLTNVRGFDRNGLGWVEYLCFCWLC